MRVRDGSGGQPSLIEELRSKITAKMAKEYKATDASINFTQRLTELAKLFDCKRERRQLEITDERSRLRFQIGFRVDAIAKQYLA